MDTNKTETITPATNSTYPKVAVQWLNQALCFYQSSCLVDSVVLRNRHLRVAAKRWWQFCRHSTEMKIITESKNFYYREIELTDIDDMFLLESDPDIHKYLTSLPVNNKIEVENIINYYRNQYKKYGVGRWAIIRKADNKFIGWAGLKFETESILNQSNFYDFSGRILKNYWHKGYSREVATTCIKYGFKELGISRIIAMSRIDNSLSNNLLTKIGFELKSIFEFQNKNYNWYQLEND